MPTYKTLITYVPCISIFTKPCIWLYHPDTDTIPEKERQVFQLVHVQQRAAAGSVCCTSVYLCSLCIDSHDERRTAPVVQLHVSPFSVYSVYCFAFLRMVPTAEMTVVLVPLAVVVTETTAGRVAVVVMRVGWARVTGIAESHLLFLF